MNPEQMLVALGDLRTEVNSAHSPRTRLRISMSSTSLVNRPQTWMSAWIRLPARLVTHNILCPCHSGRLNRRLDNAVRA
jgi:hypothetical protein